MAEQGGRRRQLVLTATPFQGHMTPMLQLGSALHAKGFSISLAHSKINSPDPSKYPDFDFLPLPDDLPAFEPFSSFLEALNRTCRTPFYNHLVQMIHERKGEDDDHGITVIHDNLMFFAGAVATDLKLRAIVLRSCSAAFLPAYIAVPKLIQDGRFPAQDSCSLQEMIPELYPLRYKDLPLIHSPIEETNKMLSFSSFTTHPSAIIWNTIEFLEHSALFQVQKHYKVPVFAVGPLHRVTPNLSTSFLEEDTSCIPWLDKQAPKSVIYVSLGSLATLSEKMLVEMAWGLANSNQPFLWVVRPSSVHGSKWVELLSDDFVDEIRGRGLIVKWAPQREVLGHTAVGCFWSHCGWNSTLESFSEGVPMLCQPLIIDQGVNARYVSYVWKIGLELECLERGLIESVIKRLLVDKEGEKIRHKAIEFKEKIKVGVSQGGSSHNSFNNLVEFLLN